MPAAPRERARTALASVRLVGPCGRVPALLRAQGTSSSRALARAKRDGRRGRQAIA